MLINHSFIVRRSSVLGLTGIFGSDGYCHMCVLGVDIFVKECRAYLARKYRHMVRWNHPMHACVWIHAAPFDFYKGQN